MTAHREKPNKLSYSVFINMAQFSLISVEQNLLQQYYNLTQALSSKIF